MDKGTFIFVKICQILSVGIGIYQNLFKVYQNLSELSKSVKDYQNLSKIIRICQRLSKFVKGYQNTIVKI